MKFTMRDKICQLIGKYEEKEQQETVKVVGGALRTMIGKKTTKEEENASCMASAYHWMKEDLKQLLEEEKHDDNLDTLRYCPCSNEGDYKKEDTHHE